MGFLNNHLSGEDTPQARRPGTLAGEAQQARTPRPHRGLPAGAAAADTAQAPLEPLSSAGAGAPAGVLASVPEGADAAQSRVGSWSSSQSEGSLFGTDRVGIRFSNGENYPLTEVGLCGIVYAKPGPSQPLRCTIPGLFPWGQGKAVTPFVSWQALCGSGPGRVWRISRCIGNLLYSAGACYGTTVATRYRDGNRVRERRSEYHSQRSSCDEVK
jgi:hypothetical protein